MTQASLLEWNAENRQQLDRVEGAIGETVLRFLREAVPPSREFSMTELLAFVRRETGVAPDSPSRVLRSLRQRGKCQYRVTDRAKSAYFLLWVRP
jgi:hypothetical protein